MPRTNRCNPQPEPLAVLHPRAVLSMDQATRLLGLSRDTLPREVREGRLRASKRAGRYYFFGAWLITWLKGGEIPRATVYMLPGTVR